ncbi:MAG: YkgJ family cysteine cluster protein [Deferrisomatales bacterium]
MRRLRSRPRPRRGCLSCGICCELYGHDLRADQEDLERWAAEGRSDLLLRVGEGGVLWCERGSGRRLPGCPFLVPSPEGRVLCGIHSTKPAVCRDYPTRAHRFRCVRGMPFPGGGPGGPDGGRAGPAAEP